MAAHESTLLNPRLKAMVIPREHGAWGMLLVPLVTGAVVGSAQVASPLALSVFAFAALALFWLRTPVEAWLGTTPIKAQSPQERTVVRRVALLLALLASFAVLSLLAMGRLRGLLLIGGIAAAAFLLQALVKGAGRSGRMPAQIIGAIGLTSTAAAAFYVATVRLDQTAWTLWLLNWLFAASQVHFVQVRIRDSRLVSPSEKLRKARMFVILQLILVIVLAVLAREGIAPALVLPAFAPSFLRAAYWFLAPTAPLDVHKLGFSELAQALVFGVLMCVAFLL